MKEQKEKYKIIVMATLLAGACYLTYYFHVVLETGTIFTHYFYIPIILAALWWRRKGLSVAIFLALLILFSHIFVREEVLAANDYFRALMFIAIAFVVVTLSERIAKAQEELESKADDRTKELREEKRFTKNVIATVPDSLLVLDANLRIKSVNRSFYEKFQTEPDEVIGRGIAEILGDKDGKLSAALTKLFGTGSGDMLENFELHYQSEKLGERIFNITARGMLIAEEEEEEEEEEELVVLEDITERKQAEEALQESEERFRAIFETAQDSVFIKDRTLKYTLVNPAMEKLFGLPASKIVGKTDYDLFDKDAASHIREVDSRVLKGEIVKEEHTKKVKGSQFSFHIIRVPMRDYSGEVIGLCGIARDITERKRAEEALRESEEKYRTLYDSSRDAIMTLTPEEGFLSGNPAAVEIFGCKDEKEFSSRTPQDLSPQYQPDGTLSSEKDKQMMAIAMEKGSHFFEWTHKRMDGNEFPATVLLTRMELQGRRMLQATVRDITERKRAEEEVEKSRKFLATIIDNLPDTVTIRDTQHRFALVNQAYYDIIGHTKEEGVIGKTAYWEKDKEVFQTGKGLDIPERTYTDIEGKRHYVSVKKVPLTDESGKVTHVVTISRDITERKRAEDRIKASLKEKEVLLREIHHRVKNNLQIVSSMLSMQAMKAKDKKVIESLLDSRSRIQTMSLIHAQLYQSENFEQVEMDTTIRKMVSFLSQIYAEAEKKITSVVTAEGVILSISQAIPCGLIINELVSNALKHAFKGMAEGSIDISMRDLAGDKIKLTVKDNGVGIPEEMDIYQTDTLGLKIVKTLAEEQLKGKMGLIRDKGTEIYVEFESITNGK